MEQLGRLNQCTAEIRLERNSDGSQVRFGPFTNTFTLRLAGIKNSHQNCMKALFVIEGNAILRAKDVISPPWP